TEPDERQLTEAERERDERAELYQHGSADERGRAAWHVRTSPRKRDGLQYAHGEIAKQRYAVQNRDQYASVTETGARGRPFRPAAPLCGRGRMRSANRLNEPDRQPGLESRIIDRQHAHRRRRIVDTDDADRA